jgi:hypothetical protein
MSASAPEPQSTQRAAELEELLAYLNASWDEERRVLSRQMHDSLGSSLTALTMHLGLLASKLPQEPALQDRAAQMKKLLHTIIDTNRAMQHRLWNDKLEFLGIRAALSECVSEFGAAEQLDTRCSLPDEEPVCPRSHADAEGRWRGPDPRQLPMLRQARPARGARTCRLAGWHADDKSQQRARHGPDLSAPESVGRIAWRRRIAPSVRVNAA